MSRRDRVKTHITKVSQWLKEAEAWEKFDVDDQTPWVLSLDFDDVLVNVNNNNPALNKLIKTLHPDSDFLTDSDILERELKRGAIQIADTNAYVHCYLSDEFLNWAFKKFDAVGIYSSASMEYIKTICDIAYPNLIEKLDFVLDKSHCVEATNRYKDFNKIAELKDAYKLGRIIHIDDSRFVYPSLCCVFVPGSIKPCEDGLKSELTEIINAGSLAKHAEAEQYKEQDFSCEYRTMDELINSKAKFDF